MSSEVQADQPAAAARLEDLKPKMQLTGTVKKVELFGAFVDVGVGRDGLVHISALSTQRVNKVTDVVKEGDTIQVWVRKVDPRGRDYYWIGGEDPVWDPRAGTDFNAVHGGSISVESEPGQGSCFTFVIPGQPFAQ